MGYDAAESHAEVEDSGVIVFPQVQQIPGRSGRCAWDTPKSTQEKATVTIKSYISFEEERGRKMFRKTSIKLK